MIKIKKESITYKISFTSVSIALIISAQLINKLLPIGSLILGPFSINQLITGSLINMILIITVFKIGLLHAIFSGIISSFMAMILQIGPIFPQIVVFIALSNVILVYCINLINKLLHYFNEPMKSFISVSVSGFIKFLFLKITIPISLQMINNISEMQIKTLSIMFSWPQLINALIGGFLAISINKYLNKAL